MRFHSIRGKLLTLMVVVFLVTIAVVLGVAVLEIGRASKAIVGSIDESQSELYALRLDSVLVTLRQHSDDLESRMVGDDAGSDVGVELRAEAQKKVLEVLRNTHYTKSGEETYPFILSHKGRVLMHPHLPLNDPSLMVEPFMARLSKADANGDNFNYTLGEQKRWLTCKRFPKWNWIVGFTVPESVKHEGVDKARGALDRTKWALAALLCCLAVIAIISQSLLSSKFITDPILAGVRLLTQVAVQGDISVDADAVLRRRTDEIGQLARAVQAITEVQRQHERMVNAMADGNWDLHVTPRSNLDKLSEGMRDMIEQVNATLRQVQSAVENVNSGADQISGASQALSRGATEQAASLEEITSSLSEIGGQTRNSAENAAQANKLAISVQTAAARGDQQMQTMVDAMAEINDSSLQIAKIIKVIDDIAFQTNLLALNAAVEAARAGRYGRGFAVVAQEVRSLAERSATAARETADLIEGSRAKVENGSDIAAGTAAALSTIVGGISQVSGLIDEIATASNEQAQGVAQINQGLGQIGSITQQNTANAEETASSAAELASQVRILQDILDGFDLKPVAAGASSTAVVPRNPSPPSALLAAPMVPNPAAPLVPNPVAPMRSGGTGFFGTPTAQPITSDATDTYPFPQSTFADRHPVPPPSSSNSTKSLQDELAGLFSDRDGKETNREVARDGNGTSALPPVDDDQTVGLDDTDFGKY